jgi:hypothetical protein
LNCHICRSNKGIKKNFRPTQKITGSSARIPIYSVSPASIVSSGFPA